MRVETGKTILLVEDDVITATAESIVLNNSGYNTITAQSGEQAIMLMDNGTLIDLILMDISLGKGIDGTKAAETIQSRHDIPIVFISSYTGSEVVDKTDGINSYGYIVKNSGSSVLSASVRMALHLFSSRQKEKESAGLRKKVFESSSVPIIIMDGITQKYIDCNPAAAAIYGLNSVEETIGKSSIDISASEQYDGTPSSIKAQEYTAAAIADGQVMFEWQQQRPDGELWDAEVHLMSFELNERPLLQFTIQDITERNRIKSALESWKKRYDMIVSASGMVVYEYNIASGEIKWGDSMHTVLGYSDEEITGGIDQWEEWLHPDDRKAIMEYLNDSLAKCAYWDAEYRLRRSDGTYVWVRDRGYFIADASGAAERQVGLVEDITERKLAEDELMLKNRLLAAQNEEFEVLNEELNSTNRDLVETENNLNRSLREKETLIREVYHRTKNTMQVIRSMIELQAEQYPGIIEIQELVKNTEDRIQAISLVHQMLYSSQDLSRISIKDYVHELSAIIIQSFGISGDIIKFNIKIDDQFFLLDTAIPFGLILNELLTNSFKYAFPDNMQGVINILLSRVESDKNILRYSDNGIGVPAGFDFRNRNTMGMQLIFGIGEQQMMGDIKMENNNGVACTFEFHSNLYKARV